MTFYQKVLILILFSSVAPFTTWANAIQETILKGYAPNYLTKEVRVYTIADYFTNKHVLLAKATVGENGKFELNLPIAKTQEIKLEIGANSALMYVEGNKEYHFTFPEKATDVGQKLLDTPVSLILHNVDSTDVNYKINYIEEQFDQFMYLNFEKIRSSKYPVLFDSLKTDIYHHFQKEKDIFIIQYIRYSLALYETFNVYSKDVFTAQNTLYQKYIKQQPVLHHHKKYIEFWKSFYAETIEKIKTRKYYQFYDAIEYQHIDSIEQYIIETNLINNKESVQLLTTKVLMDLFYKKEFPDQTIRTILSAYQHDAITEEVKQTILNALELIEELTPNQKAPQFTLRSDKDEWISLNDFKGKKYVYISFYQQWCVPCRAEFQVMKHLKNKYGKQVEFISISLDKDYKEMIDFKEKNNLDWTFLYASSARDLIDQYRIHTFPQYVFINREGTVHSAPALGPAPSSNKTTIENDFMRLFPIKKKKTRN